MTQTIESPAVERQFDQVRADAFVGKVLGDTVGLATTAMASLDRRSPGSLQGSRQQRSQQ
jgi:hypothetical protein